MKYQTILTIKKSEKATVELAAVDMFVGPVIVKRLKGGNPEIYRLLSTHTNCHIPQIYAVEEQEDELLVVEEYVDGESLKEHLQKGLLSDEQKLTYALQLCEAVGFLHTLKPSVIHKDIKPSNILINGKGELKLIDFDASRQYKETPNSSDTRLLGTVEYAPPEQFGYSQTDVRSDIYSMGVVFHEMCPTEDKKLEEQWEKIAEKCTSFDPKNRYQSVAELARKLEKLVAWKKRKTRNVAAWLGGAMAVYMVLALTICLWPKQNYAEETSNPTKMGEETAIPVSTIVPTETPTQKPTVSVQSVVEELQKQKYYIDTFYKGLDTGADFMQYSTFYEGKDMKFVSVVLCDLTTEEWFVVPEEAIYNENNILHINSDYFQSLAASCYRMRVSYRNEATGRTGEMETHLLLSEGSQVEENAQLFDNNYLDFYYEYHSKIHLMLANDMVGRFKDIGTYRILENGRVIEIDTEFLMQHIQPGTDGKLYFTIELEDGRSQELTVAYKMGMPSYAR